MLGSAAPRDSPKETKRCEGSRGYARAVASWALVEQGDREAINVFLTREEAEQALADCLRDEPGWRGFSVDRGDRARWYAAVTELGRSCPSFRSPGRVRWLRPPPREGRLTLSAAQSCGR